MAGRSRSLARASVRSVVLTGGAAEEGGEGGGKVVAALLSLSLLLCASALARDAMSGRRGGDDRTRSRSTRRAIGSKLR